MTSIIFPDRIEWENAEAWSEFTITPFPREQEVYDSTTPRRFRLYELPDGTVFRDRKGRRFGKVGAGPVQGSVVVVNSEDQLCQFDAGCLVAYANEDDEPRVDYAVVVVVSGRDAQEARTFVKDELNDIHWDKPLEVRHVGDPFEGIPESMANLETVAVTVGGELPAGHEGHRHPRPGSQVLRRAA